MAGPKEPGSSGPIATVGQNSTADSTVESGGQGGPSDRPIDRSSAGARVEPDAKATRATTGRIPSLTPLKSVASSGTDQAAGKAAFRPHVTAYWTPPVSTAGQGQSGFIRIATPISTRPDGVVSIISPRALPATAAADKGGAATRPASTGGDAAEARAGIVSISAGSPAMYPETPPFGISTIAGVGGTVGDPSNAQGVPLRAGVARSGRIPFRVGEYEVATRLAQGGTGSIYVCRRAKTTGPLFALKVIRQHAQQKEAVMASFRREARVGKLLRHPNALTVIDEGTYEGQPFLILPYVEGGTVSSLVADGVRAPAQNIVTILLDVLRALQHAHHLKNEQGQPLGMVHGDISPDNILVGTDGIARLTDFGSARMSESPDGEPDTFGLGKPSYMSPEQLRGEPLDMRSDLFAVGIVMWTALTGQKLFAAENYDQTVMRVMRRRIPPPSSLGGPPDLDEVCMTALNRSREGRFSSADQMADALMTAAVKVDLVATRERVSQWVRRDMAEPLTEVRRRVEHMFGDNPKSSGTPAGDAQRRPATTPLTGVPPAATIQMRALPRGAAAALAAHMGEKLTSKGDSPARTLFIPGPSPVAAAPRLSRRQWYIIVSLSLATFFLTLMIGSWISRPGGLRRAGASAGSAPRALEMSRNTQ